MSYEGEYGARVSYNREEYRPRRRERSRSRDNERRHERRERRDRRVDDSRERRRGDSRERRRGGRSRSPKRGENHVNKDYPFSRILRHSPERESGWDVAPAGYEHMTPGEFRDLRATGALPLMKPNDVTGANFYKKLVVGNLSERVNDELLLHFFNDSLQRARLIIHPGNPVSAVQLNSNKSYALVHFRSAEEATIALVMDGALLYDRAITVRRPREYTAPVGMIHQGTTAMSGLMADSMNKLFVACLPTYLNDDQVKELLSAFGELKAFNLVKDGATGLSKGYCFCEYLDPTVTDLAIAGLHQMLVGDKRLVVQRAVLGAKNSIQYNAFMVAQLQVPGIDTHMLGASNEVTPTTVLCLMNMVTSQELEDDEEYQDIFEDIKAECIKFGEVVSMEIPRPIPGKEVGGLEKVYVEFDQVESCIAAYSSLAGRKFASRIVVTSYYDVEMYKKKQF